LSNPTDTSSPSERLDTGALIRDDPWPRLLFVYALYLAATIVLTWPVAPRIGRYLPGGGPGDPQTFLWNMWWLKFSIFRLHQNPLWCPWIAWPFGASFAYNTNIILYGAVATLLSFVGVNLAASVSLLFLNSFALTGLGSYLWCREFGTSRRGAFVGGFVIAFCIYRFGRGLCHYNLLATEFLPFFWLALKRGFDSGRMRPFLWAAVVSLLLFWQDIQLFMFAGLFGALALTAFGFARPDRLARASTWHGLVLAAAVFLLGSLPYWLAVVPLLAQGEYSVREGSPTTMADVLSFFVPWPHHWLLGRWTRPIYDNFPRPELETAYIGCVALTLAGIGFWTAWKEKRRIGWMALAALLFLVLSFGDHVEIAGRSTFRLFGSEYSILLPGELLAYVPGLRQFRVFSRFIFLAVFALAVPVALAVDRLEQGARKPRLRLLLVPLLLLLISLEVASLPYKTHLFRLPGYAPFTLLERVRSDPETTTVFTVPPTIYQPQEVYYQMFHEKPIYGCSLARRPAFLRRRYYAMPAIGNFFWESQSFLNLADAEWALTPEFVDRFIELHNIKYVILAPSPKSYLLLRLIESRFPILRQWSEEKFILYELERPPADRPLNIDLSQYWGILYTGRGFTEPADIGSWAIRREAELVLPIRGNHWKALTVEMTPFSQDPAPSQTAELTLNGRNLGRVALERRSAFYQFAIPSEALPQARNDRACSVLRFRFGYVVSPSAKGHSRDRRTLAAAVRRLHVLSAPRRDLPVAELPGTEKR